MSDHDELRWRIDGLSNGGEYANVLLGTQEVLALLDERDALERRVAELEAAERLLAM